MKHTYFADLPTDSNYLQRKQRAGIIRFGPQIKHTFRLQQQVNKHEKIQSAEKHFFVKMVDVCRGLVGVSGHVRR